MTSHTVALVCAILLCFTIDVSFGRGVLTIRLTGFQNTYGRTYDGTCCDPTPKDHGMTCYDQCDYVMRLIVNGLGRANDHVFLFHRPISYDSNNIIFQNGDSNLLLTVLFDDWPEDDRVKMNAFFYDYDDFDHTTTLVDWFETDLRHSTNSTGNAAETWGHFQKQTVVGNRQSDKTTLTFEWSAMRHKKGDYATIDDSKVTFTPEIETAHIKHPSASEQTTDPLGQSWSNSLNDSFTELHKTIPDLLKPTMSSVNLKSHKSDLLKSTMSSVNLKSHKSDLLEHFSQNIAHKSGNVIKTQNDHIFIRDSLANLRRNSPENLATVSKPNSNPKLELFKGILAHHSVAQKESLQRTQLTTEIVDKHNQDTGNDITPLPALPATHDTSRQHPVIVADSNDENNLYKPPFYDYRRRFGKPRSWFNHFSSKPSPFKSKHLTEDGKKFEDLKRTAEKFTDNSYLIDERHIANEDNNENDKDDVNFHHRNTNKERQNAKILVDETSEHSQILKDVSVRKLRGRKLQKTEKQLRDHKKNSHQNDLKVNLTVINSDYFVDSLEARKIKPLDFDSTKYYIETTTRRTRTFTPAWSPNNVAASFDEVRSSATPRYTGSQENLLAAPKMGNTLTKRPFIHSSDYKNHSLSGLNNQKKPLSKSYGRIKPNLETDKLSTVSSGVQKLDLHEVTSSLLKATYYPPLRTANPHVQSSTLIHPQHSRDGFHKANRNSQKGSYKDVTQVSLKSYKPLDNAGRHYQHDMKNNMVSERNQISNFEIESTNIATDNDKTLTPVWNSEATFAPKFQYNNLLSRTTEGTQLSYTHAHEIKAHALSNHYQTTASQRSKALVRKTQLHDQSNNVINAAAAVDRLPSRPWKQKYLQTPENILTNHHSSGVVTLRESVRANNIFPVSVRTTRLPISENQRKVIAANLPKTDSQSTVAKIRNAVSTTSHNTVSTTSQSTILRLQNAEETTESSFSRKHIYEGLQASSKITGRTKLNRTSQQISGSQAKTRAHITDWTGDVAKNKNKLAPSGQKYTTTIRQINHKQAGIQDEIINRSDDIKEKNINIKHLADSEREGKILAENYSTQLPVLLEAITDSLRTQPHDQPDDIREKKLGFGLDNGITNLNEGVTYQELSKIRQEVAEPSTSSKLQRHSVKSLTAVKYQTHSPAQWYVPPRQIPLKAAINSIADVKFLTGKIKQEVVENTKDEVETVNQIGEKSFSRNYITILDTKLETTQSYVVSQPANIYTSFTDSSNGNNNLTAYNTNEQYRQVHSKDRKEENRIMLNPPLVSTENNHIYKPTSSNQPRPFSKSIDRSSNLTSTGHTRQPLAKSFKKTKQSNLKTYHLDKLNLSVPSDNDRNMNARKIQSIVHSIKHQDATHRAPTSGSVTSSGGKNYKMQLKINERQQLSVSINKNHLPTVDENSLDWSFGEGYRTMKSIYIVEPSTKSLVATNANVDATKARVAPTEASVTATKARMVPTKASIATTKGIVVSTKASVISTKGNVISTKANVISTKTNVISTKENVIATKTNVVSTKANVFATKENVVATKANVFATKEIVALTKENVASTKPDMASTKPGVVSTKESVAATIENVASTKPNMASTKPGVVSTKESVAATKGRGDQTFSGGLKNGHVTNSLTITGPFSADYLQNNKIYGTDVWKPFVGSLKQDNKSSDAPFHHVHSNSDRVDASGVPFNVVNKGQNEDIKHNSFNLVLNENFKEKTQNSIRKYSEKHRNNHHEVPEKDDILWSGKQFNDAENVLAQISTKSSFNKPTKNPIGSLLDIKTVDNKTFTLDETSSSLVYHSPSKVNSNAQLERHKDSGHLDGTRVLKADGRADGKADGGADEVTDGKADGETNDEKLAGLSKSMSKLQNNANPKDNSPAYFHPENVVVKSTKPIENKANKPWLNKVKSLSNDGELANNILKANKTSTNNHVSVYNVVNIPVSAESQTSHTNLKRVNTMEDKLNSVTPRSELKNASMETYLISPKQQPVILGQNDPTQESVTKYASHYVTKAPRSHKDKKEKSSNNVDSKQNLPEIKTISKLMNYLNISSNKYQNNLQGFEKTPLKQNKLNIQKSTKEMRNNSLVSLSVVTGKMHKKTIDESVSFNSITKTFPDSYGKVEVNERDNVTQPQTTSNLVSATATTIAATIATSTAAITTTTVKKVYVSTTRIPPLTKELTTQALIKGNSTQPNRNQSEQQVLKELDHFQQVVIKLNNLKTNTNLTSNMPMSTNHSRINIVARIDVGLQEAIKNHNSANVEKNVVNKIMASVTEHPYIGVNVTSLQKPNNRTKQGLIFIDEIPSTMKLKPPNTPTPTATLKNPEPKKSVPVISSPNFTGKPITANHNQSDPFEMMDLFMARQHLLGTILKIKQAVDLSSFKNTTLAITSAYEHKNSSLTSNSTRHVGITATKPSSQSHTSPIHVSSAIETSTKSTLGSNTATITSTISTAGVFLTTKTDAFVEETKKPYKTTTTSHNQKYTSPKQLTQRTQNSFITPSTLASTTATKLTMPTKVTNLLAVTTTIKTPSSTARTNKPLLSVVWNTTKSSPIVSTKRASVTIATILPTDTIRVVSLQTSTERIKSSGKLGITVSSTQVNRRSKSIEDVERPILLAPNFDKDGTKIVYSINKRRVDDVPMAETVFPPNFAHHRSMNTLPEHGFVLHTLSPSEALGKPINRSSHRLPLHKLSQIGGGVRRPFINREMNLDKFRSYVKAIRNHPTVNVPFQGLYTSLHPEDSTQEEAAELPDPVRRVGSFYTSMSNVGSVFTRYWPTVLGVSVGSIFLVTALVTSILCRQRRLLIQRSHWTDSPQHVSEPPDTSEYTSSSEASLTSDLTRSSINLM